MGRHAAPGLGEFLRELGVFALKVLFWGVVVFGAVVLLPKVVDWFTATTTTAQPIAATTTVPVTTQPTVSPTSGSSTTRSTVASTTTTSTTLPVRGPADVHVQVLNSTDRTGLAAALTESLAAEGYQTVDSDNYPQSLETTHLWFAPGFDREAARLAADYAPDAVVEPSPDPLDVDVLIVIGASYQG
jgi:hypothetical protein